MVHSHTTLSACSFTCFTVPTPFPVVYIECSLCVRFGSVIGFALLLHVSQTYLPRKPNPRKRLLVTCQLAPPNPKCYVCASKPEVRCVCVVCVWVWVCGCGGMGVCACHTKTYHAWHAELFGHDHFQGDIEAECGARDSEDPPRLCSQGTIWNGCTRCGN